jgi:hypothetical protein
VPHRLHAVQRNKRGMHKATSPVRAIRIGEVFVFSDDQPRVSLQIMTIL